MRSQRQALVRYLNATFYTVRLTSVPSCGAIKTPFFLTSNRDLNNSDESKPHIVWEKHSGWSIEFPALQLLKYIEPLDRTLNNRVSHTLPLRWFFMLKEFYLPDLEFVYEPIDHSDKVRGLTDLVIRNMIHEAFSRVPKCTIIILDNRFIFDESDHASADTNAAFPTTTKLCLNDVLQFQNLSKYKSVGAGKRYRYSAYSSSIEVDTTYTQDMLLLDRSWRSMFVDKRACQRADNFITCCKSSRTLVASKHVHPEEMYILHEILNSHGIRNRVEAELLDMRIFK